MTETDGRPGDAQGMRPHAFDPALQPDLFSGVLARRVVAFVIDVVVITIPIILFAAFIALLGLVTFGLGWLLFWLAWPLSVVWALLYYGLTLSGPESATLGMRIVGIEMRTWYGAPAYFVLGAVHAVVYWVSVSALTPLILLVGLFNERKRLLHDFLLGTVIVNKVGPVGAPPNRPPAPL